MDPLTAACRRDEAWLVDFIRQLVSIESPSRVPVPLAVCGDWLAAKYAEFGADVHRPAGGADGANHVLARWPGPGPKVLMLGHFDTVWPVGQLTSMPIREESGRLHGPGVLDMKAGLGIGLLAIRALEAADPAGRPEITMLATSDEEVGSASSRALIETLARQSRAVLVLEPALPGGAVKTARKGVGEFRIDVRGVSSHAGADPAAGASAIHELARVILDLEKLRDPTTGVSVNAGVIEGGTRSNVVAEHASAHVDVRVTTVGAARVVEKAFAALAAADRRVRIDVTGSVARLPMERSAGVVELYEMARLVAQQQGRDLAEGATGGASDGNFTAALGVPTLDGLGAVGDGPHARHEHVMINELAPRAALVAGLLARLAGVA